MTEYEFKGRYGDTIEKYILVWSDDGTYGDILDIDGEHIVYMNIIAGLPADKMLEAVVDAYWNGVNMGRMTGEQEARNRIKRALGL